MRIKLNSSYAVYKNDPIATESIHVEFLIYFRIYRPDPYIELFSIWSHFRHHQRSACLFPQNNLIIKKSSNKTLVLDSCTFLSDMKSSGAVEIGNSKWQIFIRCKFENFNRSSLQCVDRMKQVRLTWSAMNRSSSFHSCTQKNYRLLKEKF